MDILDRDNKRKNVLFCATDGDCGADSTKIENFCVKLLTSSGGRGDVQPQDCNVLNSTDDLTAGFLFLLKVSRVTKQHFSNESTEIRNMPRTAIVISRNGWCLKCDQIVELKVAQFPQKLLKMYSKQFLIKMWCPNNFQDTLATFVTKFAKNF